MTFSNPECHNIILQFSSLHYHLEPLTQLRFLSLLKYFQLRFFFFSFFLVLKCGVLGNIIISFLPPTRVLFMRRKCESVWIPNTHPHAWGILMKEYATSLYTFIFLKYIPEESSRFINITMPLNHNSRTEILLNQKTSKWIEAERWQPAVKPMVTNWFPLVAVAFNCFRFSAAFH